MKFEANIPSYLRTGHGVFPVKKKDTSKFREVSGNFYEQAKRGFDIPVTSETKDTAFAPTDNSIQPQGNFLSRMQKNMEAKGPIIPSSEDPINPFIPKPIGPVLPDRLARSMQARGPIKPIPGQLPLPLDTPSDAEIELDDELPKLARL